MGPKRLKGAAQVRLAEKGDRFMDVLQECCSKILLTLHKRFVRPERVLPGS